IKPAIAPGEMERVTAIYTYCQGVVLGAELELLRLTRREVHAERIDRLLHAVQTRMCHDGVIPGAGGGDGGLFAGILARYLALVATDLPPIIQGAD
ncbi:fructose-bisphosphate aldolase, partial [Streptomyces sp. SID10244]|nr:fructose-bisphosphate aldolase [Streptomyces sp. SID10244]